VSDPAATGEALVASLTRALAALESGDVDAAAAAMAEVAAVCDEVRPEAVLLSPERLALARSLHARCEARALAAREGIVAELLQSATHRRATNAYGSGT
jgi:hypothetical protein